MTLEKFKESIELAKQDGRLEILTDVVRILNRHIEGAVSQRNLGLIIQEEFEIISKTLLPLNAEIAKLAEIKAIKQN